MSARDLVVRAGDRVTVAGRYVRADGVDWLDTARVMNLSFMVGPPRVPSTGMRLVGLDADRVPLDWVDGSDVIAGSVRVTGVWRDDVIVVDGQQVVRRRAPVTRVRGSRHHRPAAGTRTRTRWNRPSWRT